MLNVSSAKRHFGEPMTDRERIAELEVALEMIGDIARGLRKCRHGRTCCAENDNTVGAINEMVKALASLRAPHPANPTSEGREE